MYTAENYINRGNKTLFWDVYIRVLPGTVVIRLCFGMYTSGYYLTRGNKTLFWDVYIRVLPGPW